MKWQQLKINHLFCFFQTGTTALFFAAQGGYVPIVTELLAHGAEIDLPSYEGVTPLFVACQCNHLNVVRELAQRNANIQAKMKVLLNVCLLYLFSI